ncbi:putative ABC transporter permease [Candidatus Saccharibacteria bacterium]|nr:putative ABC transporter permease [Candidatus Saccharibacteria bacterium]
MDIFLETVLIFFLGSTAGWVIELFFRRIVHRKWVNPGLLIGPYLPIYGFGLVLMTFIYLIFKDISPNPIIIILLMGVMMTLIELIGGEIGLKNGVRLWDYSDRWLNYKGLICPLFSAIWTVVGAVYYFFLAPQINDTLIWFSHNLAFSFVLGVFAGVITIDLFYSLKLYNKIKKYAKENNFVVKYEQLKMDIKERQKERKEKYSFITPFSQTSPLKNYLDIHKEKALELNRNMKEKVEKKREEKRSAKK